MRARARQFEEDPDLVYSILLEGSEMMMFSEEYMKYGLASAESIRTQLRAKTEDAITESLRHDGPSLVEVVADAELI